MLFLCKSFLPLSVDTHKRQVFLLFANPRRKFSFFHLFFFSRTRDREMKTRAARFVVEKKSQLSSLPSFQKSGVSNSAFTASFLQKTSLIFIHSAQAAFTHTHCRYARASSFSLSAFARRKCSRRTLFFSFFLSFFLYSHPRVHKLFSIIIIHNS